MFYVGISPSGRPAYSAGPKQVTDLHHQGPSGNFSISFKRSRIRCKCNQIKVQRFPGSNSDNMCSGGKIVLLQAFELSATRMRRRPAPEIAAAQMRFLQGFVIHGTEDGIVLSHRTFRSNAEKKIIFARFRNVNFVFGRIFSALPFQTNRRTVVRTGILNERIAMPRIRLRSIPVKCGQRCCFRTRRNPSAYIVRIDRNRTRKTVFQPEQKRSPMTIPFHLLRKQTHRQSESFPAAQSPGVRSHFEPVAVIVFAD